MPCALAATAPTAGGSSSVAPGSWTSTPAASAPPTGRKSVMACAACDSEHDAAPWLALLAAGLAAEALERCSSQRRAEAWAARRQHAPLCITSTKRRRMERHTLRPHAAAASSCCTPAGRTLPAQQASHVRAEHALVTPRALAWRAEDQQHHFASSVLCSLRSQASLSFAASPSRRPRCMGGCRMVDA